MKPNSALCGPVCDFAGRIGERHPRSPRPALLGQRDPVVNEQGKPKTGDTQPLPLKGEGRARFGRKNETRPCAASCGRSGAG